MLQNLNEDFRHIVPKLQIFSFYETIETHITGMLVKKVSRSRLFIIQFALWQLSASRLGIVFRASTLCRSITARYQAFEGLVGELSQPFCHLRVLIPFA